MKTHFIAGLLACVASGATAQELAGASVSLGYGAILDDDVDLQAIHLGGSAEYALTRTISVQIDGGYVSLDSDGTSADGTSIGAHAIYHANPNASFGGYVVYDKIEDVEVVSYGAEAGYGEGAMSIEGYMGVASVDGSLFGSPTDIDFNTFGVAGRYAMNASATVGINYEHIGYADVANGNAVSVTGGYGFGSGMRAEVELGRASGDVLEGGSDSATFGALTFSYDFGKRGSGAAFDRRGVMQSLGSF